MILIPHGLDCNLSALQKPGFQVQSLPWLLDWTSTIISDIADLLRYVRLLTNIRHLRHHSIGCFEFEGLQSLPDLENLIWRQWYEIRNAPQELVRNGVLSFSRIGIMTRGDHKNGVSYEQRRNLGIRYRRVQHHASIEVTSTYGGGYPRKELSVRVLQQFQGCGGIVFPVGPDRVDLAHVNGALKGSRPVRPCTRCTGISKPLICGAETKLRPGLRVEMRVGNNDKLQATDFLDLSKSTRNVNIPIMAYVHRAYTISTGLVDLPHPQFAGPDTPLGPIGHYHVVSVSSTPAVQYQTEFHAFSVSFNLCIPR